MSDAHTPAPTGEVRAVQPRTSNWNVPNVLTVLRIIAVPFFIVALVSGGTDKFLTGAAFIVLSALGELWWWVTIVILLREWGITVMRLFVIKYGVMAASKGGKIKTVLQTVALVLMLLPLGQLGLGWLVPGWVLMGAVTAITVWTGLVYVRDAYNLRRTWLQNQAAQKQRAQ